MVKWSCRLRASGMEVWFYWMLVSCKNAGIQRSAGYRRETLINDIVESSRVVPMTILMVGIKAYSNRLGSKLGIGRGWCNDGDAWTWEFSLSYVLFSSHSY